MNAVAWGGFAMSVAQRPSTTAPPVPESGFSLANAS